MCETRSRNIAIFRFSPVLSSLPGPFFKETTSQAGLRRGCAEDCRRLSRPSMRIMDEKYKKYWRKGANRLDGRNNTNPSSAVAPWYVDGVVPRRIDGRAPGRGQGSWN